MRNEMKIKPLFIPLKTEYFEAFKSGEKTQEFRNAYNERWSAKHCRVGRPVVLSKGYGKQSRLSGVVSDFYVMPAIYLPFEDRSSFWACYGESATDVSVISIKDIKPIINYGPPNQAMIEAINAVENV